MHPFPHRYHAEAAADPSGVIDISSPGLPTLATIAPAEFDGPGGRWSPETLLVAAAIDCFILTFRAITAASKFAWERLTCSGEGVLDRVDGTMRFTGLALRARVILPAGGDAGRATRLLEKAERSCLITNSLSLRPTLHCEVEVRSA